jgi:DNA adenine methylase
MSPCDELLARLRAADVKITRTGPDHLHLDAPAGVLTPELLAELRRHKPDILDWLSLPTRAVTVSGQTFTYERRWSGARLDSPDGYLALDTETELIPADPGAPPPRLALASASSGTVHCLIHPDDLGRFLRTHADLRYVHHNCAFDFWVVHQHLTARGDQEALALWWQAADEGRLHDTMLLDALVRLARNDDYPKPRDLGTVAREWAGLDVNKDDPFRLRYAELIGADWSAVDEGFFSYAVLDAIATHAVHARLREEAARLAIRHARDTWPDAGQRFGPLTETVQVKKAIALAAVERNGLRVDLGRVRRGDADLTARLGAAVAAARRECPDLFPLDKAGELVATPKGGVKKSNKALYARLTTVKEEIEAHNPITLRVPTTKTGQIQTTADFWDEYKDLHPFVAAWRDVEDAAKLRQFFVKLQSGHVHPRYTTLVRTGRTSCSSPNVQQVPREGPLRGAFVATPGHLLLAVDYSFIELRTLAAVCLRRYGHSALADVIKAGADPHAHTAALMLGLDPADFLAWKDDPERADDFKKARQAAKPINFGVPGSMGAASLARYARRSYGVKVPVEEALQRRQRLISEVYPELDAYLAEDTADVLARALDAPVRAVRRALDDTHLTSIRKVLEGDPKKADGTPYKAAFVNKVWAALAEVNRNPELAGPLRSRAASPELARRVTMAGVATLTGRIRGRVRYSQARNTPFQGLAADGAALALFALAREGFRVVGFVHDEMIVELPDRGGYVDEGAVRRVEHIMAREMEKVLGGLPAAVESSLSYRWGKGAGIAFRDGKAYPTDGEGPVPVGPPSTTTPIGAPASASPSPPPTAPPRRRRWGGAVAPVLKWHGSKAGLAGRIAALMPPHEVYVEPFAGSAAVLLAKPPAADEVLGDLDRDLIRFYRTIRDPEALDRFLALAREKALSWPELPPGPGEPDPIADAFRHARTALDGPPGGDTVKRALAFFLASRLSMSGRLKSPAPPPKNGRLRRGMDERRSSFLTALDNLTAVSGRLRNVRLRHRPAEEVIESEDTPGTLFYLDPPYVKDTRASPEVYRHDGMGEADHRALLGLLSTVRGKVMLSGYPSEVYDEMLAGWSRREFDVANHGSGARTKRRMSEILWCNF